jgi:hypothetical protein
MIMNNGFDRNNELKLFRDYLGLGCKIEVRYGFFLQIGKDHAGRCVTHNDDSGSIIISSVQQRNKLYLSNQQLVAKARFLGSKWSGGNRIIKIRDLLFMEAQIYIHHGAEPVLKLKEYNGFALLRVTDKVYRTIIKQLKNG